MANASEALSRSLDVEASLKAMLDIVTAGLAAVCVVYLPEGPDGHRRLVWPGGQRSGLEPATPTAALEQLLASEPVTAVLSSASSYQRSAGARLSGPPGGDCEVLVIPLPWHGEVLGVWLLEPAGRPRFADLDGTLLVDLGRRAAVTLHNARAYDHERAVAMQYQRDLLSALPDINGLELSAVFAPSDIGAEVGGDWYDVAQTPSGPVLASVGDVTGHDLRAAAAMGRLARLSVATPTTASPLPTSWPAWTGSLTTCLATASSPPPSVFPSPPQAVSATGTSIPPAPVTFHRSSSPESALQPPSK